MEFAGFRCSGCGSTDQRVLAQRCLSCGGIIEATCGGDFASRRREWSDDPTIWRYRSSFPGVAEALSLGEGRTPIVEAHELGRKAGVGRLYLKLELVNPTGSFKDRGLSVAASYGRAHGAPGFVGASSGNALHAQAAYAARAGLPSLALVPESVSFSRLVQPICCSTEVVRVRGDYSCCHDLARQIARLSGWYNVSTTYENPVAGEGYKSIAYEIFEALGSEVDWIAIPVGAGPLLGAVGRAYAEVRGGDQKERGPALLGVQAMRCSPIWRAFDRGDKQVVAWEGDGETVAKGIGDPLRGYTDDGTYTLEWVRRTGGVMVGVAEELIRRAMDDLATVCGLFVDPAAAAAIAGIDAAVAGGHLSPDSTVVAVMTGTGFKEVPGWIGEEALGEVFVPGRDPIRDVVPKERSHVRRAG